jgi:hypothetical protein
VRVGISVAADLVLNRVHGAGRVDEPAARLQDLQALEEDLVLHTVHAECEAV